MRIVSTAVILALAAAVASADPPKKGAKGHPAGYTWETNFEQAKLKAAESGKLLFVDFFTEW